eukprot:1179121-Prorocentrum_minimum.AAC.1
MLQAGKCDAQDPPARHAYRDGDSATGQRQFTRFGPIHRVASHARSLPNPLTSARCYTRGHVFYGLRAGECGPGGGHWGGAGGRAPAGGGRAHRRGGVLLPHAAGPHAAGPRPPVGQSKEYPLVRALPLGSPRNIASSARSRWAVQGISPRPRAPVGQSKEYPL